jgi:hypothetical protein
MGHSAFYNKSVFAGSLTKIIHIQCLTKINHRMRHLPVPQYCGIPKKCFAKWDIASLLTQMALVLCIIFSNFETWKG